jgi:hypothetical protein
MVLRTQHLVTRILCLSLFGSVLASGQSAKKPVVVIPRTWNDAAMKTLEVPLANPAASPRQVSADYYYRIPVRPIYKQYPVYAPGKEPSGYWEWLQKQEPVVLWNEGRTRPPLRNKKDWIKAGESVFDAPLFVEVDGLPSVSDVRNAGWFDEGEVPVTPQGIVPFFNYVIREKGKVELGSSSCGMCHTRVMADGTVVKGAQGSFSFDRAVNRKVNSGTVQSRLLMRSLYAVPWLKPDPLDQQLAAPPDQVIRKIQQSVVPGVMARHRSSDTYPVQVPDLIGVKERAYLDRTGLQQHRSVVDLMRYAALNQGADGLADFDGFIPLGGPDFDKLPDPASPIVGGRYSDEQLYALALYVYSLRPPRNPNRFDPIAARGRNIFEREGCAGCHTPPLYTNNKLTPAEGFTPPPDAAGKYAILPFSVGTDSGLTTKTRRGTGYYKVPSLKGVWYRSMFGHSGWCATLEDWFDPRRVRDDYVPTGFKPNGDAPYPVLGHPFGLTLSEEDRKALIAFLKTL